MANIEEIKIYCKSSYLETPITQPFGRKRHNLEGITAGGKRIECECVNKIKLAMRKGSSSSFEEVFSYRNQKDRHTIFLL